MSLETDGESFMIFFWVKKTRYEKKLGSFLLKIIGFKARKTNGDVKYNLLKTINFLIAEVTNDAVLTFKSREAKL